MRRILRFLDITFKELFIQNDYDEYTYNGEFNDLTGILLLAFYAVMFSHEAVLFIGMVDGNTATYSYEFLLNNISTHPIGFGFFVGFRLLLAIIVSAIAYKLYKTAKYAWKRSREKYK